MLKIVKFINYNFVLFIFICLSVVSHHSPANGETIIGFGDSITKGWPYIMNNPNGARVGGYEPTLETLLGNIGRPSRVLNYGVGGETTVTGVNRISSVLGAVGANYILILEGVNDMMAGVSANTTLFNLSVMIDKSRARGVKPVIGTLTPYPPHNIESIYNGRIRGLAQQHGALLADHYNAFAPNWGALNKDGLHPNSAGYRVMAQVWFNALGLDSAVNSGVVSVPDDDYNKSPNGGRPIPVYRFYSPITRKQFITLDANEKNYIVKNMANAWRYQGVVWYVYPQYEDQTMPIYRFYSPVLRSHLFTLDANEKNYIITNMKHAWRYEGIGFFVYPHQISGTAPVYRMYSPSLRTHFFTMDGNERGSMLNSGMWNDEGVAYYAFPNG